MHDEISRKSQWVLKFPTLPLSSHNIPFLIPVSFQKTNEILLIRYVESFAFGFYFFCGLGFRDFLILVTTFLIFITLSHFGFYEISFEKTFSNVFSPSVYFCDDNTNIFWAKAVLSNYLRTRQKFQQKYAVFLL